MAELLDTVTTNTTGTGASHTAAATVYVYGTFDGCEVTIEISHDDTNYEKPDCSIVPVSRFRAPGACNIEGHGTYYIRANVSNAGSSTSVHADTTA